VFAAARADVAVLVGNDQMECFNDSLIPAFAVLYGDQIINSEYSAERLARLPPGIEVSMRGRIPPGGAVYPAQADLGRHIISNAISDGFDVAAMRRLPGDLTPHAFGFVYRQIMGDQVIPSVPVFINTFYPPNQPTVSRCHAFGRSLVRGIRSWTAGARVALIATGGLTHFVIDERVDGLFFDALRAGDITKIAGLGEATFQAGTSEMKNWIPVAGAMAELGWRPQIVDYVPCYRSAAGTGNAMAFAYWQA
jgi:3-O-methylgallate 3,4-dioxygenase